MLINNIYRNLRVIKRLLPYLWPQGQTKLRVRVVLVVLCLIANKVASLYVPIIYKQAVDVLTHKSTHTVGELTFTLPAVLILAYGLVRIFSFVFSEARDAIFAKVAQRTVRAVTLNLFQHLYKLSLRFHLERQTGGITRSIERGTTAIRTLLAYVLFYILPIGFEILIITLILWRWFNILFAMITLLMVLSYIAFTLTITKWRLKFRREMNKQDTLATTKAVDSLLNFETVKYFGNEEHEARCYDIALDGYERASVNSQLSLAFLNIVQAIIVSSGLTVIMLMAGYGIFNGTMTVGDFVLVNTYILQIAEPLNSFSSIYRGVTESIVDMSQMFYLLDQEVEVKDKPNAPAIQLNGGKIKFQNVTFGYDSRRPILKDCCFTVPTGKTVAIVGASGGGKSTISRLLFRFYDVDDGCILIDDQDIRDVSQKSLQAAIGIVPQDTVLFDDTIYYNIAYGCLTASPYEVEQAARLAHLHDFILTLPDGYQTKVGERGLKLSGGEKQRVAIARTILKRPHIFVFDEATSALDIHTEREIQTNLREVSKGRTTIIIAHRLSTIVDADKILVMEKGSFVEYGNHDELMSFGGKYAEMWNRQQRPTTVD